VSGWLMVGLWGGLVGLDSTSFPQFMVARPVIAGTLTGAIFGRPLEGAMLGFFMEAFALITLPIGAARFPESGTATVAGASAYMAAVEAGLDPGALTLALAFALVWERVTGGSVVLLRRNNGRVLALQGAMSADELERRHLGAMTTDYVRAAIVSAGGGLLGYGLLTLGVDSWALPDGTTLGILTVMAATMLGTTLSLFGGARARRYAWGVGLATGLALLTVL
jgi:mannose/fructose/N-acetylgalactosamine-specific phosphotransferase system component IIC